MRISDWSSDVCSSDLDHPTDLRNSRNQFVHLRPLRGASLAPILAEDGSLLNLDRFRGKLVLLNFWATWCPPCVGELPALDRLQELLWSEALDRKSPRLNSSN